MADSPGSISCRDYPDDSGMERNLHSTFYRAVVYSITVEPKYVREEFEITIEVTLGTHQIS